MAITLNGTTGVTTTGLTSNGIDDNATSTAMTLDSSGRVGIGTIPSAPLDVRLATTTGKVAELHNSVGFGIGFTVEGDGGVNTINSESFQALAFATNGASNERMRIDSSGNVLVGKTSAGYNSGTEISYEDFIRVNRTNGSALYVGRNSSDGELVSFRKDGSTVGSISTQFSGLNIDGAANRSGIYFASASLTPRYNGAQVDNTIDIGTSAGRFRNGYFGGGVYLGGTGSANHLDDYEEGTWTPSLHQPPSGVVNSDSSSNLNRYVKVGNFVTVQGKLRLNVNSASLSSIKLVGLPFVTSSSNGTTGSMIVNNGNSNPFAPYTFNSTTEIHFYQLNTTSNWFALRYADVGLFEAHFEISYISS